MKTYDIVIVGAGILGLAHALAAHRRGLSVLVIDRDHRANGASVRNFGFVTVTGQQAGSCWNHARRSREIWAEIAPQAGIPVLHQGLVVVARRPEAQAVLEAFADTGMGRDCRLLTRDEALATVPALRGEGVRSALWSPHELRVESREAIPALAAWLAAQGVDFLWGTTVQAVETPRLATSRGPVAAERVIVCPGDEPGGLFADRIAAHSVTRCKLHMLRLRPRRMGKLGAAVMSDLSLVRYQGYSELPQAQELLHVLKAEQAAHLDNGIHLIAVQSADGSLVVGDSHHYGPTPDPFQPAEVDALILDEFRQVLDLECEVAERWIGTYASAPGGWYFADAPDPATRIVVVTAGCGASTAFSIGEETLQTLS